MSSYNNETTFKSLSTALTAHVIGQFSQLIFKRFQAFQCVLIAWVNRSNYIHVIIAPLPEIFYITSIPIIDSAKIKKSF